MVRFLGCFFLLLAFAFSLHGAGVQIEVDVDSKLASENEPLRGKVIILHPENEPVDENSFSIEDKPLKVQLVSQGKQSSISIINGRKTQEKNCISCYTFQLQGKKKGQHKLPALTIKIGDKFYRSSSSWYEVIGAETHDDFVLEAKVDAPKKLYPGQRFKATYRLYLKNEIEPTAEHLPLLDPKGCEKIGERQMRHSRRGQYQIIEFTQLLEAKEVGEISIEPGFVEGFAYQEDFFFRRVYKKPKLRAEAKPLDLCILPFPSELHPESFSGAIGKMTLEAELLSSPTVCLGDKMEVKLTFRGHDLETLKLPSFGFQKPFKETFRFSDLPPTGKQEGGKKEFILDLRPMEAGLKEIPSFEFTYFDPTTESYQTLKTEAIPIELEILEKPSIEKTPQKESLKEEVHQAQAEPLVEVLSEIKPSAPPPIEIAGLFQLNPKEIHGVSTQPKLMVGTWLLVFSLLILQWIFKRRMRMKRQSKSDKLFKEALRYEREPQKYFLLIEKAFHLRLMELGWLEKDEGLEKLSSEGLNGEIKQFIDELHHALFAQNASFRFTDSLKKAKDLFKRIGEAK